MHIDSRSRFDALLLAALLIAALLLAAFVWLGVMREFGLDDSFITYRYARSVAAGQGLVYNPGEPVLSTTAPLYALLLAGLSLLVPDLPLLGGLVGAGSIALGGVLLAFLLPDRVPRWVRVWSGAAYVLASPLWLALGMETPLWIALVLAALWLARREAWAGAGLLTGLAMLTRPDAALPGALIGVSVLLLGMGRGSAWQERLRAVLTYGLAAAVPVALFYGWAWMTYGSPFPATLSAKRAQAELGITGFGVGVGVFDGLRLIVESLLRQSALYAVFGLMLLASGPGLKSWLSRRSPAEAGLVSQGEPDESQFIGTSPVQPGNSFPGLSPFLLLPLWGLLHLLAYAVMDIAPYRWYYAPLLPGVIVLAAAGVAWLAGEGVRLRRSLAISAALLMTAAQVFSLAAIADRIESGGPADAMLPIVDWAVYREAGQWLDANAPPDAVIGVAEVGQLGFYARRTMTDNLGLLQPATAEALARGDVLAWLPAQNPDYLVFQRFREERLLIYNVSVADDPWFRASYQPAAEFDDPRYAYGPVTVFERITAARPLVESAAALDFGPLRLVGVATDGRDLPAGDAPVPVRVRLDWEVVGGVPDSMRIIVTPLDAGDTAPADTVYPTHGWTGGFSTWHTLVLDSASTPDGMRLLVEVSEADGGSFGVEPVGWLDVSFPRGESVDSAVPTFHRGRSALLRLAERAITVDAGQITAALAWQAVQAPGADYAYFLHLRREGEVVPAAQADGVPLDGRYPTYLWEAGETVPLAIMLDAPTDAPGRYTLVVGWYAPDDGSRLALLAGDPPQEIGDALPLAEVVIDADGGITLTPLLD